MDESGGVLGRMRVWICEFEILEHLRDSDLERLSWCRKISSRSVRSLQIVI